MNIGVFLLERQRIHALERAAQALGDIANSRHSDSEHPADFCAACGEPTGYDRPAIARLGLGAPVVVHNICHPPWRS